MKKISKYLYFIAISLIFALAFILKIKTYLLARPLWHDECSLAINILTRDFLGLFQPLENEQKAPIIFMILNKIVSYLLGTNEIALKFVSFISGLASVIIFYFLSKKFLENKFSIISANFLFAINYQLIYWAQKFKQYSFDVFLFMTSILLFNKLNLEKISYKKCLLYSFLSMLLIMASFPCVFIVVAYILFCILDKVNVKKTLSYSLPLIIFSGLYYFKSLYGVQSHEVSSYLEYWDMGFLKFNLISVLLVFKENFNFFFEPNNFALIGIILFVFGCILLLKNRNKISSLILLSFFGIILASFLQIYPIWQRTALYLLPISILFMSKPLDLLSTNKKVSSFIIIALFITYFCKYNFSYINAFLKQDAFAYTDALTIFPKLIAKYDKNDILIINSSTKADFAYYSDIYKFRPKKFILVPIYRYDKEYYYNFMNSLPKGNNYWFILGWEYSHKSKFNSIPNNLNSYIKEHHLTVLDKYKDNNSLLIKVKV